MPEPGEHAEGHGLPPNFFPIPGDEVGRVRYRRAVEVKLRDARSRGNEIRELGRTAVVLLGAHHVRPDQVLEDMELGGGAAWYVADFRRSPLNVAQGQEEGKAALGHMVYGLFAGILRDKSTTGLMRIDTREAISEPQLPAAELFKRNLAVMETDVRFDEESPDFYHETAQCSGASIRHIPAIRAGIERVLRGAGII